MKNPYSILMSLLDKLKERQSWCPMCGGEYVHKWYDDEPCELKGLWFNEETE